MSQTPIELKYTASHEWVRDEGDGTVVVGITDHAQDALGDLVFVELPEAEQLLSKGDACAVVESVKAASDVYSPVGGTVVEGNAELENQPELINEDPYGSGWIMRVKIEDVSMLEDLLDAASYQAVVDAEDH